MAESSGWTWEIFMILTTLTIALCCPQREPRLVLSCRGSMRKRGTCAFPYHGHWARPKSITLVTVRHSQRSVCANTVDSVSEFIFSDGYNTSKVMRHIALAASTMDQLGCVWRQRNLCFVALMIFIRVKKSINLRMSMRHACCRCFCTALSHGRCLR